MSQTTTPVAAKPSLLARVKAVFSNEADLTGFTAVGTGLATAVVGALSLAGIYRADALVTAAVLAAFGVVQIVRPTSKLATSAALKADVTSAATAAVAVVAAPSAVTVGALLADGEKVAADLSAPAPAAAPASN